MNSREWRNSGRKRGGFDVMIMFFADLSLVPPRGEYVAVLCVCVSLLLSGKERVDDNTDHKP